MSFLTILCHFVKNNNSFFMVKKKQHFFMVQKHVVVPHFCVFSELGWEMIVLLRNNWWFVSNFNMGSDISVKILSQAIARHKTQRK